MGELTGQRGIARSHQFDLLSFRMHLVSEGGGRRGSWRHFDVLERRRFIQRTNQRLPVDVARAKAGIVQDAHQTFEFELADLPFLIARGFVHIALEHVGNLVGDRSTRVLRCLPARSSYSFLLFVRR